MTDILNTIDRFWDARIAGDKAALRALLADNCTFEMVGANAFADPTMVGPAPAVPAADDLIDAFKCEGLERLDSIVDGQKAAIASRITVSYRGGPPVTCDMCDLWEIDSSGKITSLRQFVDTALVGRMMSDAA